MSTNHYLTHLVLVAILEQIHTSLFILYVAEQKKSSAFYKHVLGMEPVLDVPGMTEFQITPNSKLGIMPELGIAKIICPFVPHPQLGQGIPRSELYLYVPNPEEYLKRALEMGANLISEVKTMDWGDDVGYVADPDGHILAFAKQERSMLKTDF